MVKLPAPGRSEATNAEPSGSSEQLVYVGSLSEERGAFIMLDLVEALAADRDVTLQIAGWAPPT